MQRRSNQNPLVKAATGLWLALGSLLVTGVGAAEPVKSAATAEPRIGYISLKVRDLDRSLKFYATALGMKESRRLNAGKGVVEVLLNSSDTSAASTGLMLMHDPSRDEAYDLGDGFSRLIVYVPDLAPIAGQVESAGGSVFRKATRIEPLGISILLARDPDGYVIEFIARK